tara:strand:- start:625 stop:1371 length:747 start_codon:yes stop_codon:yes gene_type:complete
MNNLIIGENSQLGYYLEGIRVSSRDIPYGFISKHKWDRIYLCFAEQRTFIDKSDSFNKINYELTKNIVDRLYDHCNQFVFYSTTLLWSNYKTYDIEMPYSYKETDYLSSKENITNYLQDIEKAVIHYPCNFNSKKRKMGFLFTALYVILKKEQVELQCLDFNKEISHASYIAEKSQATRTDSILAPGYCINVRELFTKITKKMGIDMNDYLKEVGCDIFIKPNEYCYNVIDKTYTKDMLIDSFVEELR